MADHNEQFILDNKNNTLYFALKDEHPCWLFVANAIIKLLYVVPGILGNLAVVIVSCQSKTLRSSTNHLLALNSALELLHQPAHFLSIILAFTGLNFINFGLAVRICSLSLFGLLSVGPCLFFTGLDRLLAVSFLSFYQRINPLLYVVTIAAMCAMYGGYAFSLVILNADQSSQMQVPGNVGDLIKGEASNFYYTYTLALNAATICLYLLVGIIIRFRSVDQANRRIFRSLLVIIVVNLGGYFLMRIYSNFVVPNVQWSALTVWTVRQAFAIPLNLSAGSNGYILYWTSAEYRKAFRHQFALFGHWLQRRDLLSENKVQVLNMTTISNNHRMRVSSLNIDRRKPSISLPGIAQSPHNIF